MEDFLFQGELQDVQINNKDKYEDLPLLCDFHSTKTPIFHRIFPYIIILVAIILSLFVPQACVHERMPIELKYGQYFNCTYAKMKPINSFLDIYLIPSKENQNEEINGTIFMLNYANNKLIESNNFTFQNKFNERLHLLRCNVIKFDMIDLLFVFNKTGNVNEIEFVTANETFEKVYTIFEVVISVITVVYFIDFFRNITSITTITFEQNLTMGLAVFLLGFCDFLGVIDMFSAGIINVLRKLMLRDIFYCYFFFYISSIFIFFIRDPTEIASLTVAIPFTVMLCSMLFLMGTAACINFTHSFEYNPLFKGNLSEFTHYEILSFIPFTAMYVYHYIQAMKSTKPTNQPRFENYKRLTAPFVCILAVTFLISFFIPESSFSSLVPLGVIFGSSIGLIHAHKALREELALYDKAENLDSSGNGANHYAEKGQNYIQPGSTLFDDDDDDHYPNNNQTDLQPKKFDEHDFDENSDEEKKEDHSEKIIENNEQNQTNTNAHENEKEENTIEEKGEDKKVDENDKHEEDDFESLSDNEEEEQAKKD